MVAELEDRLATALTQRDQAAKIAKSRGTKIHELEGQLREVAATHERERERANLAIRMLEREQVQREQTTALLAELHRQLARQPEVVVESILTGIAPLFIGYQNQGDDNARIQAIVTAMGEQDLDNMGGSRGYYPNIEFDESMEARSQWPVSPDEMSAQTLPGSRTTMVGREHQMTDNGETTVRKDGQTMFTSGSGRTSPPGNAVE